MYTYFHRLFKAVSDRGLCLMILGQTGKEFIYLVRGLHQKRRKSPNILIAGGFHGEEIAGPHAILSFLENASDFYFINANLSFLPCVNPIGFLKGRRYARRGEKTNCGFCHPENGDKLSREGRILMNHRDLLVHASIGGFLSLHEDVDVDKFYIYDHKSKEGRPTDLAIHIRDLEALHFDPLPDGMPVNEENDPGAVVKDGIVCNLHDGSFEDMLSHGKTKNIIVTETPAKGISLERRVEAGVAIIEEFLEFAIG